MRAFALYWVIAVGVILWSESAVGVIDEEVTASESIPYKQEPAVTRKSVQRVALVLLLAIGVCFAAALLLRKQLKKRGLLGVATTDRIVVIANRKIAPRLTVVLLNVDDQPYVLVRSGDHVHLTPHISPDGVSAQE